MKKNMEMVNTVNEYNRLIIQKIEKARNAQDISQKDLVEKLSDIGIYLETSTLTQLLPAFSLNMTHNQKHLPKMQNNQ